MSKISDSLIKNTKVYKVIKDLVHCSICLEILIEPQQCFSCDNFYCEACLNEWLSKSNVCPFKCHDTRFKDSRIAKNALSKLTFKCLNECNKEVRYEDYFSHEAICENSLTDCPCCKNKVMRKSLDSDYLSKIKELENELEILRSKLKINDFIPSIFGEDRILATKGGNIMRTISSNNALPAQITLKIFLKNLKHPGNINIGVTDIIVNENRGYLGGDMGKGKWGISGNGSIGEEGRWINGATFKQGDTLILNLNNGEITYSINGVENNYFYKLGQAKLYFAVSFHYEGEILQLV